MRGIRRAQVPASVIVKSEAEISVVTECLVNAEDLCLRPRHTENVQVAIAVEVECRHIGEVAGAIVAVDLVALREAEGAAHGTIP